ncbi:MAG TPA: FAD-binding oxidoreductase [Candidatus Limnocylindria bacterium]
MGLDVATSRAIDGTEPSRVVRPQDAAEVADVVRSANDAREAIVLWGGGTRIGVGDAPTRYDVALDLTGLSGIVEHTAADLVCTVRAGTTLAELAAALAPSGQRWPVDCADPRRATVGGTIASAAPAPSRLRFQHPRDWTIGCEAVLGDGTRARAGGRVVKNVSGFDLTRLYSGTYGTLAALVEVSLKLVAVDEAARVLRATDGDLTRLAALASRVRATLPVEGIALTAGRPVSTLHVRVAGSAAAVARIAHDLDALGIAEEAPDGEWTDVVARPAREERAARCSTAPGREADAIGDNGVAFVGTGIAYRFEGAADELARLRERREGAGGALVIERARTDVRRTIGTWGTIRMPGPIARRLKEAFDPRGVLAPGRIPV